MTEETAGAVAARIAANLEALRVAANLEGLKPVAGEETLFAALRRIERKAEIMQADARAAKNPAAAGDAEEIRLLAQIAMRNAGADGNA